MFKQILVPLDGSLRAEYALPVASQIAHTTEGSLLLVQVVRPPIDYGGGLVSVPILTKKVVETEIAEATDYLKTVAALPSLAGIETSTKVLLGTPAQQIVATAEAHEVDIIVLCSHGRTGFIRWALGSVAHTLVHQSTVPVLVLRQNEASFTLTHLDSTRPLCVLVPLDGSPLAEAALNPAAQLVAALAAPAQRALHLVQVVRPFPTRVRESFFSKLNEEVLEHARTYLVTVAERFQTTVKDVAPSLTYSVELASDVASALVSLAENGGEGEGTESSSGCDLIAISTHSRGGLERWVMGSVTECILNTTKLPMLIVRPQKKG